MFTAQVVVVHGGTNSPWRLNVQGRALTVVGTNGPASGGNPVVISGAGLDVVTNASLCGVQAAIFSQSATQLVLIAGAGGVGTGALSLEFNGFEPVSFLQLYTYNPSPRIFGELTGWEPFVDLPSGLYQHSAIATPWNLVVIGGRAAAAGDGAFPDAGPRGMTPVSHARVLRIAAPIVISNATVPLLGAVDTAVVGQMGQAAPIGAVGLGAVVLASIYWIFGFLRMGTTGLVAQAKGEGDSLEISAGLIRAVGIGLTVGLCLIALQTPMLWAAFQIAPASDRVETLAQDYLSIRIWGAPATISLYAFTGWLIALERTRAVLVLQLLIIYAPFM
ncbi:hypothetical protein EOM89_14305, partial [Candidatus Falkowbacteria bacterium]|nr:hypothetical protein [Candidatus Falkowbacteria bacterium]